MDTDVHLSKSVTISAHQWLKRPAAKSSQICTIRIDISTLAGEFNALCEVHPTSAIATKDAKPPKDEPPSPDLSCISCISW
jgi:hypothetical protein